ncbi:hypothetical protein MF271_16730 [Deinococcus sp. KNUC1210]|uniref:hypothetical protein n=1 Tax=Deinococcus sp. KNUC1210 TaxID=2917691 RepID=UPI001EF09224|nr:hypothetical protein [Deinococcus sp. KNUC1210]ULH15533.1 hypothetical protein MF271_16730 [Deinococcus sp. KNUC1210]
MLTFFRMYLRVIPPVVWFYLGMIICLFIILAPFAPLASLPPLRVPLAALAMIPIILRFYRRATARSLPRKKSPLPFKLIVLAFVMPAFIAWTLYPRAVDQYANAHQAAAATGQPTH